ncbi:MAG: fibronectin type III domain-containing protein [Flavobacteriales bacterium]
MIFLVVIFSGNAQTIPPGFNLIAYEGFDYSNNTDIANQNGGSGWSGNWEAGYYGNSSMFVYSSGLSYTGLNVTGNKLQWGGYGQYQPHSIRRAINNPNSGIVYLQFISDFNSSGGGTDRLDLNLKGTTLASFGGNNAQQKMSILAGGEIINSTYSVYDLSLVIIQIDYTNNTTKMWVNSTLSTFDYSNPGIPDAIYNNSIAFDTISLTFRSGGQIDEITVFKKKTFLTRNGNITDMSTSHLTKYGSLVTSERNGSINVNGIISTTIPDAPIIGIATATSSQTTVSFTAPISDGDSPITLYTAIASPGGNIGTLAQAGSGTIIVPNLINGKAYSFTITATNAVGTSVSSTVSNSVINIAPAVSRTLSFEFDGSDFPQTLNGSTWSTSGSAYGYNTSWPVNSGNNAWMVDLSDYSNTIELLNSDNFNAKSIWIANSGMTSISQITFKGYDANNTLIGTVIANISPNMYSYEQVTINIDGIRKLEISSNASYCDWMNGCNDDNSIYFDDLIFEQ